MREIPPRVTVHQFPAGYAGTVETLRLMSQVLREDYAHPRLRARVRELFAELAPLDVWGEVQTVFDWTLSQVRYMRDPRGLEHITRPVPLDEQIDRGTAAEDCEGMALYAAALLAAAGIPSAWEIQGTDGSTPDRFTHCALAVQNPRTREWRSFDVVGAVEFPGQFGLGDSLHRDGDPLERWDSLEGERMNEMSGLLDECLGDSGGDSGFFTMPATATYVPQQQQGPDMTAGVFNVINPLLNMTSGLIQTVAKQPVFGPTGQIVAEVFRVGDQVYNAATGAFVGKPQPSIAPLAIGAGALALALASGVL